jgi:hypothetical protein
MLDRDFSFSFTDAEYEIYKAWCKENHLDGYQGAIGGATTLEIVPTSLGDVVTAYAMICVKDEIGEISYDKNGKPKKRRIDCEIRGI